MNSTNHITELIQEFDLESFLTKNKHLSATNFLLQSKGNSIIQNTLLAEQLKVYPKALYKLPSFTHKNCWFTSKSYEQSSSETSALFKSRLFKGAKCLDLSGGLGVDDWAFSQSFEEVISLDPDKNLNELARCNWVKLGIKNVQRFDTTAEIFLKQNTASFDLIYLDSDRRVEGKKSFSLHEGSPAYLEIEAELKLYGKKILLKLSPLIDLSYLIASLSNLSDIYVVGIENEVKEVLVLVQPNYIGNTQIHAVELGPNEKDQFFSGTNKEQETIYEIKEPQFFLEPNSMIIKAGLTESYGQKLGLVQAAKNSSYYLSNDHPTDFLGRFFQIDSAIPFSKSELKKTLKTMEIEKANVSKRNFPMTVDEIKKAFQLKDGGDWYLFFTTLQSGIKMVYLTKKKA